MDEPKERPAIRRDGRILYIYPVGMNMPEVESALSKFGNDGSYSLEGKLVLFVKPTYDLDEVTKFAEYIIGAHSSSEEDHE